MFSVFIVLSTLSVALASLRGVVLTSKQTCPVSKAAGVLCAEVSCFADRNNYQFDSTANADGFFGVTLKNCIPRSVNSSISFISVSDCTNSCQKKDSVLFGTTVFRMDAMYGPTEYCKRFCIFAHDGQYKLSAPNNVNTQSGCISSANQRCNLCSVDNVEICRPTPAPTYMPSAVPTFVPSANPTAEPTYVPTAEPTFQPTYVPTAEPTYVPTAEPTAEPTYVPTAEPTYEPTYVPTAEPTYVPTAEPTAEPTYEPTYVPTAEPTYVPTAEPTAEPTFEPTFAPTNEPTYQPTFAPTAEPSVVPTFQPTVSAQSLACGTECGVDSCCCTVDGVASCYNIVAYGSSSMSCENICSNVRCSAKGLSNRNQYLTCACIKSCNGNECNSVGGGICSGSAVCCCASRVDYTVLSTKTFGSVCTNCNDSVSSNWVSAAQCAYEMQNQSTAGTTSGTTGGNGNGNGNGNGKF